MSQNNLSNFNGEEDYWFSLSPQERLNLSIEISEFALNFLPYDYSIKRIDWGNNDNS